MPARRKTIDELVEEAEKGKSGRTLGEAKMKEFRGGSVLRALRDLFKKGTTK